MQPAQLQALSARVQHNCHISDARHGGDYPLCVFLMKMREYYRWERGLPFGARLPKDELGAWLADRERLWERLERDQADYLPLEIAGESFPPFAVEAVNQRLEPEGLVYGAGLGAAAKPHFLLARLERKAQAGGCAVRVSSQEYARDLGAPAAMSQGEVLYVRRESLRRLLWEKLESWRWNRPDNALGRAFACYDFDGGLEAALERMTDRELEMALLHELGEHQAGVRLGDAWDTMLLDLAGTPAELAARAVRDHLADCLVTLPALAERGEPPSLHFLVGNLSPLRRELFPGLERAYRVWRDDGSAAPFTALARSGQTHWARLAEDLLATHAREGPNSPTIILAHIRANPL